MTFEALSASPDQIKSPTKLLSFLFITALISRAFNSTCLNLPRKGKQWGNQTNLEHLICTINSEARKHDKRPISYFRLGQTTFNPVQAGVFWNHISLGGHNVPPLFLICLGSNCNQTWHAATLGQNLSKSIKISLTSLLGAKYAVIKPFLVSFQVNIQILLLYPVELKFGTGVNSEALISNSSQNIWYKYVLKEKNAILYEKTEDFAQMLLDESGAMATLLDIVN